MNLSKIRHDARELLKGNWGWAATMGLIFYVFFAGVGVITDAFDINSTSANLINLLITVLTIGIQLALYDLSLGKPKQGAWQGVTSALRGKMGRVGSTYYIAAIYNGLWALLLIIPGVVKMCSYSQATLLMKDYIDRGEAVTVNQAITESRKMMDGHKGEYFTLMLTMLGWFLLYLLVPLIILFLTAGSIWYNLGFIGAIWYYPYWRAVQVKYYEALKQEQVVVSQLADED